MANENMIKFLRGNVADLPQTATAGALYFTKDEGVYLGLENGSYHRYGDFITVADVNALPDSGAHATCMYYCTKENILARYDSAKGWIQINKQPTAEEMKTLLGLGSLAYLSEVTEDNLDSALKEKVNTAAEGNHAHLNKDVLDDITSDDITNWNDAVSKEHEHTFVESELNKIADGDVEKWNTAEAKAHEHANINTLNNINEDKVDAWDIAATTSASNTLAINAINDESTGILKQAKAYSDGLANNYATKAYVGDIPNGEDGNPMAASVIAYINKKTDGIATSGNLEALGNRVPTAEGEIDARQEASAKHVEKEEGKSLIANTEIERLAGMSDGANKVEASATNGKIKIDGVETTVYAHPDKHTIAEVDGLETALASKVASVAAGDASVTIGGTATAPTVAAKISSAEGNALTLAEDGLKVIIPESTKVEASETNGNIKVDGEEVTVYEHPEKHAIAEVDGLQDALNAINDEETGVLAQAKAYVDTEDKFVTDILTVDKFGGIAAGSDLNGMTTHEILNQLLYPYIAFTINSSSRSAAAATLENGATQTLSSASISITKKSKPITSVKLLNGSTVLGEKTGDDVAAGGTIKFEGLGITVSKDNNPNLKFTVTDGTTSTDKNVGASTFVYPYYTGECAADATIDETLIEGLTKKVESKGNKTVTHSCENGRMVIAYPKAHGVLKSILDPNNFETIGDYTRSEVSVTGLDGTTQTYYVYASGAATVSGFKVQYKY